MEKKKRGRPPKTQEEELNNSLDESGGNSKRRNSSDTMEKKKEKGRPPKPKTIQEEELKNSIFDGAGGNTNASSSSSSLGHESASTGWKPRTRCSLALGNTNKKATVSSQLRIPVQKIDGNSSDNSSLMLVNQILFESNSMDKANHVAAEAKDIHSELESISPAEVVEAPNGVENQPPPRKNVLNLEKFTLDLLAQTPQPELPFQVASPCSDEIMVPEREPNVVSNISANGTARASDNPHESPQNHEVMSESGDPMIDVQGYRVKKEMVPLLKAIFNKYGDIARESTFSMQSRSCLLELVCSIYKRLEASKFMQLTALELKSMLGQIGDLRLVKVDVGWLHTRLDRISKAREMYDGVATREGFKARSVAVIGEKQRAVRACEEELQACMADAIKLQERLQREKDELAAARTVAGEIEVYDGSLVRGLV